MKAPTLGRYGSGARFYDLLSLERPVYRVGRERAIELLRLTPGDRVLDVGCGTGLNFPSLREHIGPAGHVVGVDASAAMLGQARKRSRSWANVTLLEGDAGDMRGLLDRWEFDAVIATYAMSIIPAWRRAWQQATERCVPGARAAIVDLAMPTGAGRAFWPAARFACFTGGVDLTRQPWSLVDEGLDDVTHQTHRAGHVVLAVGTVRGPSFAGEEIR
ncbi:methyltransferase domain-containing protein [Aeromicrobium sp.]|uniref:class I SAM-dependent methyltransferase n=1 Tax=Aeromicrobium sp. TaxID=1871063 RepID=UPI0030BDFEEE